MGLCLIAAGMFSWLLEPANWVTVATVALGLGAVIFVHELGHFAVAKWCGVKCEKFYLGFDIGGWKLCKFQWGETEYGIGVLPLGGYVKMLGQEDNPARVAEEIERARQAHAAGDTDAPLGFDPRSYMAKSVPKRMAIISAGVIMNVIFAVVFATIAYSMGVTEPPCIVGSVLPGDAAWKLDLRAGDKIKKIGKIENPRFRDMTSAVIFGDIENGLPIIVERPGEKEPLNLVITPERKFVPMIGIASASTLELTDVNPVSKASPTSKLENGFKPGDVVVAIGDRRIETFVERDLALLEAQGEVAITVKRTEDGQSREVVIQVPPVPMRSVGLVMEAGEITAVQNNSPAAEAGLRAGDRLLEIDGDPIGDPLKLPMALARRAGQAVTLSIERTQTSASGEKSSQTFEKQITLRGALTDGRTTAQEHPLSIDAIGVALAVNNKVAQVVAGSSAEKAGIKPGEEIVLAKLIPPPSSEDERTIEIALGSKRSWPTLMTVLQEFSTGSTLELTLAPDRTVTLEPSPESDWLNTDIGLNFKQRLSTRTATSFGDAVRLGLGETGDALSQVYRFLTKIGRQVPVTGVGGPVAIAQAAGASAEAGMPQFLLFLTMLSANLAILNFLPIPLLDGGHMVFLILEGIRRKPVSERIVIGFHYAGFLFLISLMLFVLALDFGLISRHG